MNWDDYMIFFQNFPGVLTTLFAVHSHNNTRKSRPTFENTTLKQWNNIAVC
jgi:hypothetical protein